MCWGGVSGFVSIGGHCLYSFLSGIKYMFLVRGCLLVVLAKM